MRSAVPENDRWAASGSRGGCSQKSWWAGRVGLLALLLAVWPALVQAQARVVAFPTQAEGVKGAAEVDRALRSALQERSVTLAPAPALDLDAMQLALDCTGVNARCLRQVAERTHGEIVVAPSLRRRGEQIELRILYFAVSEDESRFAARRESASRLGAASLDAIPAMLDELFTPEAKAPEAAPLPAPELEPQSLADPAASQPRDEAPEASGGKRVPVAPLLVAGGGVVLIGAGLVVGAMMRATEKDYADQPTGTVAEAEQAYDLRERGKRQALIANVMLGAGAAVLAAGGVWLTLELIGGSDSAAALAPDLGPDRAGLQLSGRWGAP